MLTRSMGVAEAAARLKHDLAKSIRLSAPEALEADTEALRARLCADILATRRGPAGSQSATEVFDAWITEEARHFGGNRSLAERVSRIAGAMDQIRGLAARLGALSRPELERLDSLTRLVADECRLLSSEARSESKR